MKTLVLGLGNPILSDDAIGLRVVEELEGNVGQQKVTLREASVAGLGMLDLITGYDRAIIIDAIQTIEGEAGRIYRLDPEELDFTRHAASPHDVNLATALELGKRLGLSLPQQIVIFAIEVADASTFSEECTPKVREAIPVCVSMIIEDLSGHQDA